MRAFWLLSALAAASLGFGGDYRDADFKAIKGVRDFSGRMIVRPIQPGEGPDAWVRSMRREQALRTISKLMVDQSWETDEYLIRLPKGAREASYARNLYRTGNFDYLTPDWVVYPTNDPNDPLYAQQWHLQKIGAPAAWDHFVGNASVTVAVCDTGIRLDHEDFVGRLAGGYNSISGLAQEDGGDVSDINGHGTMASGVAAAAGNNARGVSGIGWDLKLMPVRVTNNANGSTTTYAIITGARWAADHGARIVSVSYSGVASPAVAVTGDYLRERNALLFWAAGNNNQNLSGFDHLTVTVVGATDANDNKLASSSYGRGVDLFAPGENIWTTTRAGSGTYGSFGQTSAATPCAAGAAALIMAANPMLTAGQVEDLLLQSCDQLGAPQNNEYWGWGRVDASNALNATYGTYAFLPADFSLQYAAWNYGALRQLQYSDNDALVFGNRLDVSRKMAEPGLFVEGYSTNAQPADVRFTWEASSSMPGVRAQVYLFDFSSEAWVPVSLQTLGLSDDEYVVQPSDPSRFRDGATGAMRAFLRFAPPVGFEGRKFNVAVDQAYWLTPSP